MDTLWGIDLGGTKTEIVRVFKGDPTRVLLRHRIPTEADKGYEHVLANIVNLVKSACLAEKILPPRAIGIGTPGSTDPVTGLLRNSNTVCLNGRSLRRDLAAMLDCETVTANDANCFALAEATMGAAQGAGTVLGVIMGTGVGGGIVVDGRVLHGKNGIAGEWGHMVVDPFGEPCYCGRRGCVETLISGPAIERHYLAQTGQSLSLKEIVSRHKEGNDEAASQSIQALCERYGRCLAMVVNVLDPDVIILGGGLGQIDELYDLGTREALKYVFHDAPTLDVRKPTLGDSAGVFGAALLVSH